MTGGGAGPLAGIRVVELAGIGPGPFAAMLLAASSFAAVDVNKGSAADLDGLKGVPVERYEEAKKQGDEPMNADDAAGR